MKPGLKSVLWSIAALLLILSVAVPGLNLLTVLLLMVPYVVLFATLSNRSFLLHLVPVWIIAAVILGPAVLIIGLFFLIPSIYMGHMYRKRLPASTVLKRTMMALLALILIEFLVLQVFMDISIIDEMSSTVRTMFNEFAQEPMLSTVWSDDYTELWIKMMVNSLPMAFIIVAFLYTVITHYISRRILNASGMALPGLPQAKDWRLPRVLVMYYLIIYIMALFVSSESTSFISVALMNLLPLLRYAFAVQAVGFFFFIAHERKWNKAVPVLIAIPVLLFPPLSIIGVLDAAFPIRKSFTKS